MTRFIYQSNTELTALGCVLEISAVREIAHTTEGRTVLKTNEIQKANIYLNYINCASMQN